MSDGLVEDEFTNRPDDDELAFLHYEKLFRIPLENELRQLQEQNRDGYWDSYNHFSRLILITCWPLSLLSTYKYFNIW